MHHVDEGTAGLDDTPLALRPRADLRQRREVGEVAEVVEIVGHRVQFVEQFDEEFTDRLTPGTSGVGMLDDQFGLDAVSGGEPAILAYGPLVRRRRQ